MRNYDVIVIGGSAAGLPAAITARRHYPDKSIMLLRKEAKVLIPCGIPYVFGTVGGTDKNLIPDGVLSNNGIDLMVDEARSLDRANRTITTAKGETVSYQKLVLAMGSEPLQLPIPGLDKKNVFYAKKDVPYLDDLLARMKGFRNVVVLGGGFIGVEFADEIKKMGLNVTIVELLPSCLMLAFEEEMCKEAEEKLRDRGVNIITNAKLVEVLGGDTMTGVKLSDGREIKTDMLLVGVGVRPNVGLAREAGLEVDRGGIMVDNHQRTSDEHIFACGDCTSKRSFFTGKPSGLKLASIASMESRIAGANLFETRRENLGVVGVFSTAIGDLVLATAGMSEKAAKESGFEVATGTAEAPNRHPGGMPGMAKMKVKLVFDKNTGEILGGMARGGPSVGELINTVSACIQKKMTADDIAIFQLGTHPAVTASPIAYQMVNAA
ncbi:MAG: FAD-dependent oxidoreductase, partial [Thermoplasmata archaeon]|nr:FAD-dependent oxidoreductase [Thermoplasmata archaeon]